MDERRGVRMTLASELRPNIRSRHVPDGGERNSRGGVSTIMKRYAKSNNKYVKGYDKESESVFIPYLDAKNLYGWAMDNPLHVKDFRWMRDEELGGWKSVPCILEVDLEYPDELHDLHNEYPLTPEKLKIDEVDKLIINLRLMD